MTTNLPANIPVQELSTMAEAIATSGLFGMKKKEEALALMLIAQAEGLHPAIAARDYHVIKGRPSLKADAMMARFQLAGGSISWKVLSDTEAEASFTHPQGGTVSIRWDMERARQAQLMGNDMWKKYPRQMLRSRVISEGIRTVFPGVSVGIYTPEENEDIIAAEKPTQAHGKTTTAAPASKPAAASQVKPNVIDATPIEVQPNSDENPFSSGEQRRAWMVKAKNELDAADDAEKFASWLATYGGNLKHLGEAQQKTMNDLVNAQRVKVEAAAAAEEPAKQQATA